MQGQPKILLNSNDDALANPPQFADSSALHTRQRWLGSSQEKGAVEPYVLHRLTDDARFKRANISGDIR
jgi:hypothetical protein